MTRVLARDARGWGTMWEIHFDLIMGLNVLFKPLAKKEPTEICGKLSLRTLVFG